MVFRQLYRVSRPLRSSLSGSSSPLTTNQFFTPAAFAVRHKATAVGPGSYGQGPPSPNDVFLQTNNANYVDEMYRAWKQDPESVHISWQVYFKNLDGGAPPSSAFTPPPTISPGVIPVPTGGAPSLMPGTGVGTADVTDHLKVQLLVRAFQVRGHHIAKLDPLGILEPDLDPSIPTELELSHYNFKESDLDKTFALGPGILPNFITEERKTMSLREIVDNCKRIYCGSIGAQYVHIPDRVQCNWLRDRLEVPKPYDYSIDEKRRILDRMIWSDSFERFIAAKYPNEKRFGLEGCESLIPGMKAMIDRSVDMGINSIVMGMPHRGRLNVLSNVVRKPNESIFCEFGGSIEPSEEGSGDVKYHLGMNYDRPTPNGKRVSLSLVANPSHLEAGDPVVLGKTRAIQHYANDESDHVHSMGVLLHGDAAFAAQGVVYETMGFHELASYSTGGTIHIVVNNQIGFTTDPRFARSTPYCTDIAKSIDAPIFHVNGDDVEAVNFIHELASDWRATFKKDVVIDIVCYRRHGHNETDQPSFTQPLMYRKINEQVPTLDKYIQQLLDEGSFTKKDIDEHKKWVWDTLEENYQKSRDYQPTSREWLSSSWNGFKSPKELATEVVPNHPTGVAEDVLKHIGKVISTTPEDFHLHRNLKRIIQGRGKSVEDGDKIDWSTAEALAFGSLLQQGKHIRVSGQDVERGTFSQRHAVLHDQENESQYIPLNHIDPDQAKFVICNSSLSEFGALGFELGYSLVDPNSLVIWEAQFGDFANNAQCIIDQFIASGEKKWLQRTGLMLSLPHGYDGQGPEHSSARVERFLMLCDDHPLIYPSPEKLARQHQDCNMQVVYPSTAANYFHVLRRQIEREFRKPLIVFFSKSLLRLPAVRSDLSEMTGETYFQRYIPDPHPEGLAAPEEIKRHVFCTGQVYYALLKARDTQKVNDVAISRVEQLSPFPHDLISEHADKYPNAEIIWCQEEPLNAGAWAYVEPRLRTSLTKTEHHKGKSPKYTGRDPSASPATGNKLAHKAEEARLIKDALGLSEVEEK